MKKTTILIVLLALTLSLSACGKKKTPQAVTENSSQSEQKGLMEWLEGGGGTECVMKAPEGDMIIKSQDGKTRIEGMGLAMPAFDPNNPTPPSDEPQMGITVYNGDWMYSWSGDKGTKMNQKRMEEFSDEMSAGMEEEPDEPTEDWTDMVADMEEMDIAYECTPKKFAASEFEEPSGVEFTDLTEQFEQMAEMTKNLQDSMNSGNFNPNDFDPSNMPDLPELPNMDAMMQEIQ